MARSKLTVPLIDKIVEIVEGGMVPYRAARMCGIPTSTFFDWMRYGDERKTGLHRKLRNDIKEAEARAEEKMLSRITVAADEGTWTAAAWVLERRWKETWGRHIKFEIDYARMSDEQLERLASGEHPGTVLGGPSEG